MNYITCYNCSYDDKVPGICRCDEIVNSTKIDGENKTVAELTVIVRRLTNQLNEVDSTNTSIGKAKSYLHKKNL